MPLSTDLSRLAFYAETDVFARNANWAHYPRDLLLITTILGNREERMLQSEEEYREVLAKWFVVVV